MKKLEKITLIISVGTSPKVITSTIEAFTTHKEIVPDEIIAITTKPGEKLIREEVINSDLWDKLLTKIQKRKLNIEDKLKFGSSDSIRVLGDGNRDFDDISSLDECDAAADQILRIFREFTSSPDKILYICIAGGRKSLSALMFSCMTLLGRDKDRIFHVFIDENKGKNPSIAEISYVRTRGWIEKRLKEGIPSYSNLVKELQGTMPEATNYSLIKINLDKHEVIIGDEAVRINFKEFGFLVLYAIISKLNIDMSYDWDRFISKELKNFKESDDVFDQNWFDEFCDWVDPIDTAEGLKITITQLRAKVQDHLASSEHKYLLFPKMRKEKELYPSKFIDIKPTKYLKNIEKKWDF